MRIERIAAERIRAGAEVIYGGCRYRAIGDAERSGRGEVMVPAKVIRGDGARYSVSRPNVTLTLTATEAVDVIKR